LKIKNLIKKFIPNFALNKYRILKYKNKYKSIDKLSLKDKFSHIYQNQLWNQNKINQKFFSGSGTYNKKVLEAYYRIIKKLSLKNKNLSVADLGCGDFNVGKRLYPIVKKYYAIDIVKNLIIFNKKKFRSKKIIFLNLDLTNDILPNADIGIIRQVLQHLSNSNIKKIIDNINNKYKFLIITEHYPSKKRFNANLNIFDGPGTRMILKSGVVLHKSPFNLKFKNKRHLLTCEAKPDAGFIVTTLYELKKSL
jgi:SAM-dependent methyltransferase